MGRGDSSRARSDVLNGYVDRLHRLAEGRRDQIPVMAVAVRRKAGAQFPVDLRVGKRSLGLVLTMLGMSFVPAQGTCPALRTSGHHASRDADPVALRSRGAPPQLLA